MTDQMTLLVVGFLLTSVVGGLLGYIFQRSTWKHQHRVERAEHEREQAIKTFEEVSCLLDKRLYRMRLMYWAAKRRAKGGEAPELNAARNSYRDVLLIWNDNLNRCLALVDAYFGEGIRQQLETVYEEYAAVGRALDQFVRDVSTHQPVEVPPLGRRLSTIGKHIYDLNVRMLQLLQDGRLGRSASSATGKVNESSLLEFGAQGSAVRRMQQSLLKAGHLHGSADGIFGNDTERALRAFQKERGLDPDAIAGPRTWVALLSGKSDS